MMYTDRLRHRWLIVLETWRKSHGHHHHGFDAPVGVSLNKKHHIPKLNESVTSRSPTSGYTFVFSNPAKLSGQNLKNDLEVLPSLGWMVGWLDDDDDDDDDRCCRLLQTHFQISMRCPANPSASIKTHTVIRHRFVGIVVTQTVGSCQLRDCTCHLIFI